MNTRQLITALVALTVIASTAANADQIFKWTDAQGNVHYEDRPSGEPTETRLNLSYNRTDNAAVSRRMQALNDSASARQEASSELDATKQEAAENKAATQDQLSRCQDVRASLKVMLESRRLYKEDSAGERTYLGDTARARAKGEAEKYLADNCSN